MILYKFKANLVYMESSRSARATSEILSQIGGREKIIIISSSNLAAGKGHREASMGSLTLKSFHRDSLRPD